MMNTKIVKVKYDDKETAMLSIGNVNITLTENGILTVREGDKIITFPVDRLQEFINSAGHEESY